jgi:hypothetical protein
VDQAVAALEAGKHVMIEKPIDVTLEAADASSLRSGRRGRRSPSSRCTASTARPRWQLSALSTGGWSLAGAWAILAPTSRRGTKRFLFPMMVSWVSSGMLFAYNLFFSLRADSRRAPSTRWPVC